MTIIVGLVTETFVALVADRRLTYADETIVDDNRSKSVIWCGKAAWGYTGLAEIDGTPTNQWLVRTLGVEAEPAAKLRDEATAAFSQRWARRLQPGTRRTAFLGVTWNFGNLRPVIVTTSNFISASGHIAAEADDSFSMFAEFIPRGQRFHLKCVGQALDTAAAVELRAQRDGWHA